MARYTVHVVNIFTGVVLDKFQIDVNPSPEDASFFGETGDGVFLKAVTVLEIRNVSQTNEKVKNFITEYKTLIREIRKVVPQYPNSVIVNTAGVTQRFVAIINTGLRRIALTKIYLVFFKEKD